MKLIETERVYCFEITPKQYAKLLKRDDRAPIRTSQTNFYYHESLTERLCHISGVREASHDPMSGPVIFVRVESENQEAMAVTLEEVKKTIARYVR